MKFKIRKLKKSEADWAYDIINSALQHDFKMYPKKVSDYYRLHFFNLKFFKELAKKKTNIILGCFEKENLIGIVAIRGHAGGVAYIEWLAVDKKYRNQGVGTILLKQTEKWLIENKFHYMFLQTESQKNINYYNKRGFRLIGVQKKSWFGMDEYLMEKILQEKPFEEIFTNYLK